MRTSATLLLGLALGIFFGEKCGALDASQDSPANLQPAAGDYFFAEEIGFPQDNREKTFPAATKRANFTSFQGVENVTLDDGKLVFTLTDKPATLGWGNYMGSQAVADIQDMWQQENAVRLRLRQSAGKTKWTVRPWCDGARMEATTATTVEGTDWQEVDFAPVEPDGPIPDGLELTIEGPPGTRVELEWLKLVQRVYEGYCRTEFVLPEGKVWRAVAAVGSADHRHWYGRNEIISRLYVNGRAVPRGTPLQLYHTTPVDVAPYLKPGRNCVGFYGLRIKYSPFIYFQAKVVMENGQVVTVRSDDRWKYCPREAEGWNQAGFDDSGWAGVMVSRGQRLTGRDAAWRLHIPAYDGRLVIKNPARRDLFYVDTSPVVVEVYVPPGLKECLLTRIRG